MENKLELDEVDLNRLYAALEYQLNFAALPRAEVRALMELRDRIGKMLDGEEEPVGNFFSSHASMSARTRRVNVAAWRGAGEDPPCHGDW